MLPRGPPPFTRRVTVASGSLSRSPKREAAQSVLPSAAVATGEQLWIVRARSAISRAVIAVCAAFNKFYYEQRILADDAAVRTARYRNFTASKSG